MQTLKLVHQSLPSHQPALRIGLHVVGDFSRDQRAQRTALSLQQSGYTVQILDVRHHDQAASHEEFAHIPVEHLAVDEHFAKNRFRQQLLLKGTSMLWRSVWRLLHMPVDLYHALDLAALPACYLAAMLRHKRLVFESYELPLSTHAPHELTRSRAFANACLQPLLRKIVPRCAGVIAVSPPIISEMRQRYPKGRYVLLRNMLPYQHVQKSQRLREYLQLPDSIRLVLYQGALQPDRGLDTLIQIARFLEPCTVLVLMGNVAGISQDDLVMNIKQAGVESKIRLVPAVPYTELLDWTSSADLGLLLYNPQHSLNIRYCLPNKLFEYVMAGLPILATRLEAVEEILRFYQMGQITREQEPERLAHAINRLLADTTVRSQMHANALYAAKKLCWEKEAENLLQFYEQLETSVPQNLRKKRKALL